MAKGASKLFSLKRTVYYDQETNTFCQCSGDFYKHCVLRLRNDLPCAESIIRISPIERDSPAEKADKVTRGLDKSLKNLEHALKGIEKNFKI